MAVMTPTEEGPMSVQIVRFTTHETDVPSVEAVENPLPGIPECRVYQQELARWVAEPPRPQPVTVVGEYA